MHFDERQIKHIHNYLDDNLVSTLLNSATIAKKSIASVGTLIDNKYVHVEHKEHCNAYIVDYSSFTDILQQLINSVKNQITEQYKVEVVDTTIDFLYYTNGCKYWPHIDGQMLHDDTLSRGDTKRDITASVYLNDNYTGGEIYFQFFDKSIKPNTGDIIMYPSDYRYMHGVNEVVGERYAIVLWFTTNPPAYSMDDIKISNKNILNTLRTDKKIN